MDRLSERVVRRADNGQCHAVRPCELVPVGFKERRQNRIVDRNFVPYVFLLLLVEENSLTVFLDKRSKLRVLFYEKIRLRSEGQLLSNFIELRLQRLRAE